jgi:hypothetical protein
VVEGAFTVVAAETDLDATAIKAVAEEAVTAAIDALDVGDDVTIAYLYGALQDAVDGLLNITDLRLDDTTDPPVSTTSLVIPFNARATPLSVTFTVTLV